MRKPRPREATLKSEPVMTQSMTGAGVSAVFTSGIMFLRSVGTITLTDEQTGLLVIFVNAILTAFYAWRARSKVTPWPLQNGGPEPEGDR